MSNNIKTFRKALSLTQERLSERVGVTRKTICSWETGKSLPNATNLTRLSEVFNIAPNQIIELKGDNTNNDTK